MDVCDLARDTSAHHVCEHTAEADQPRPMRVEIGGERGVPRCREPVRDPPDVVVQPKGLVQHDDARRRRLAGRREELAGQRGPVVEGDLETL